MNQKNVNEPYDYSAQLYNLYGKGKEACSIFQVEIRRLTDSASPERDMLSWSDEDRKAFENTFKRLDRLSSEWYGAVMDILNQIPLISLRARFSANVKTTDGELRALYSQYHQTGCMKVLLRLYDTMKTRTERLPDILKAYEEFCRDTENAPKKRGRKAVIYRLTYDDMAGVLRINDIIVHKCNIESELDKAIRKALRAPGKKITVRGNLRSSISRTKIPKSLQKLMFVTGKGVLRLRPEISASDLREYDIDRAEIDVKLQQLL